MLPEPHPSLTHEVLDRWRARRAARVAIVVTVALTVVSWIVLTVVAEVHADESSVAAQLAGYVALLGPVLVWTWLRDTRQRRERAFHQAVEDATFSSHLPDMATLDERLASHRAELALLVEMRAALEAGNAERYQQLALEVSTGPRAIVLRAELEAVMQADRHAGRSWDVRLAVGFLVAGWLLGLVTDVIRH